MDQTRAINALAPFVALAKSANSPRAAADLVTQATSSANTYVFAELLQQPNIQALSSNEQYGFHLALLQCFAWGTWESYKSTPNLPQLSPPQTLKLRLLSLLPIASQSPSSSPAGTNLSYSSLCRSLDLSSAAELESLVTQAIYNNLVTGTLNPASQTVIITSVAPLRDLAPGSVQTIIDELAAWSGRCEAVLADLESEIKRVQAAGERRAKREALAEKQIKAVTDAGEKSAPGAALGVNKSGHNTRGSQKREQTDDDDDSGDAMDIDSGGRAPAGSRKKSAGGGGGSASLLQRLRGSGAGK